MSQKKWTDILISTAKTTIPRAKVQVNGQNYASKGSIWDIAHLCVSKTFGDMIKNVRKLFFKKSSFCNFFFKKSGHAFWPLQQKPWLLEQKCSLDGPNNGS